jgi:hypothetical protein
MVLELPESDIRKLIVILVALTLLKFGVDLNFGIGFGVVLIAPVIALYLALLTAMYFATEVLVKEEDRRATIFAICALVLAISAYIHLACLMQFVEHSLGKCSPP